MGMELEKQKTPRNLYQKNLFRSTMTLDSNGGNEEQGERSS